MVNLSRRSFLQGAVATAAAVTLPVPPTTARTLADLIVPDIFTSYADTHFAERRIVLYLSESHRKKLDARMIETMKRTLGCHDIQFLGDIPCPSPSEVISRVRASSVAATYRVHNPNKVERLPDTLRDTLKRVSRQKREAGERRRMIGSPHGGAGRTLASRGRSSYA